MEKLAVKVAAHRLMQGGVIAYPTEAVWGLGCDPQNEEACLELLQIKQRPIQKGMILIAGQIGDFEEILAALSPGQYKKLDVAWQQQGKTGAVTFLVPDVLDQIPFWIKGSHRAVALRVSHHPVVRSLCKEFGGPIVSTSANITGKLPARSRVLVEKYFGSQLNFVVPGQLGGARNPSKIVDFSTGQLVRAS
ncbi:tRNA threonylcarbamoyladenosine biosynthesis protein RimN [Gammaproteobacteria bacterium LSUCC0112]|nr:tRNA threonylcarbamoyladenosine biosynthesis protein RimN [Gammaproteobacteria bacterium LSUCC0112]